MTNAVITIQSYVRMHLARLYLKHCQYKQSNDVIIQELYRHPKFSRVSIISVFYFHRKYLIVVICQISSQWL